MTKTQIVYGKNSTIEYLNSKKLPISVLMKSGIKRDGKITHIVNVCSQNHIKIEYTTEGDLNRITKNGNHQGIVFFVEKQDKVEFIDFDDLLEELKEEEVSCVVLLDSIQDTHNMGAIIRSAEFFGISAIVVPIRESAPINETVYKTSSGAVEYMRISQVNNLKYAIDKLKENEFWIYGTYIEEGEDLKKIKFDKKSAIILGSEGKGMKKSIKDYSDFLIFIDRICNIGSLNVSVTSGIIYYEYSRQHGKEIKRNLL